MNKRVYDSKLLRDAFDIRSICISYMDHLSDMGKWQISKIIIFMKTMFMLIKELIYHRPDLTYFQISPLGYAFLRDIIFVAIMKLFSIKIIFHIRGKGIKNKSTKPFKRLLYRWVFLNSVIICLSDLLIYDIADVFFGRVHVVNNGIPDVASSLKLNITPFKRSANIIRLLFLSNLDEGKGIYDFITAMGLLSTKSCQFEAIIVGAEAKLTRYDIDSFISQLGLQNCVKYLGAIYGDEKWQTISSTDVVVFPTKYANEAFPAIPIEAMQFGKPVIATKEGAIPDIVEDGVTGFLVDNDSPEQIAEKLEILINDSMLREAMGKAGRKKYETKYRLETFELNLLKVFKDVS